MPTAVIKGLTAGDKIDLAGVNFDDLGATILEIGNVLQIDADGSKYQLRLDPSASIEGGFSVSDDGTGHTSITYVSGPVAGDQQIDPHSVLGNIDYSTSISPYNGVVDYSSVDYGGSGFVIGSTQF